MQPTRIKEHLIRNTIAAVVRDVIRSEFPNEYSSLCHVFAIVGANLASLVLEREYRPVAGLAAIDSGGGRLIVMSDDLAFTRSEGGAFHCWIESNDHAAGQKELLDFTFGHNHLYAHKNGFQWSGSTSPRYLWGLHESIAIGGDLGSLKPGFGKNRIWVEETDQGVSWMARHLEANTLAYIELTTMALKKYQKRAPSTRLKMNSLEVVEL